MKTGESQAAHARVKMRQPEIPLISMLKSYLISATMSIGLIMTSCFCHGIAAINRPQAARFCPENKNKTAPKWGAAFVEPDLPDGVLPITLFGTSTSITESVTGGNRRYTWKLSNACS